MGLAMTDAHDDRLLTVDQVAERYGLHEATVRKWIKKGVIPAVRLAGSRTIRVRESEARKLEEPLPLDD